MPTLRLTAALQRPGGPCERVHGPSPRPPPPVAVVLHRDGGSPRPELLRQPRYLQSKGSAHLAQNRREKANSTPRWTPRVVRLKVILLFPPHSLLTHFV